MKKLVCIFAVIIALFLLTVPVFSASSVPESVLVATESVVRVLAEYSDGYSTGSGFVIKSNGEETLVATNYHVVEGSPYNISIWISENETVSARILAYTNQKDMCILSTAYPLSLDPLMLDDIGAKQGEAVYAVGFPGAADYLSDKEAHTSADATITDGIVSAVRQATVSQYGTPTTILQINAAINSGNSGGPLFNSAGNVVGINTYGINDSQGIFGAIDISELKGFLADHSILLDDNIGNTSWRLLAVIAGVVFFLLIIIMIRLKSKKNKSTVRVEAHVSVREYMANHPNGLGVNDAVTLLLPVALQLRDLHNSGSTHLEVSPDTVSLKNNMAVLNKATGAEYHRYTSGYAAPEVYRQSASNLSDIYSFCALLYLVATGNQLENALARADNPAEDFSSNQIDDTFKYVLAQGFALNPEDRFESMQELIVKLSSYNVRSCVNLPPAAPAKLAPTTTKKHQSPVSVKKAIIVALVVLMFVLPGTYFGCYLGARANAKSGDWSAANRLLFAPQITKLHDPQLLDYIKAGKLMANREYCAANVAFKELVGYLNARELKQEASYRYAIQCADANEFDIAVDVMTSLSRIKYKDSAEKLLELKYRNAVYLLYEKADYSAADKIFVALVRQGYENAAEMQKETQYCWACSDIENGEYISAYNKLSGIRGYSDVNDILTYLSELIYSEGQKHYYNGSNRTAKKYFSCITPHLDSEKYLDLISIKTEATLFAKTKVSKLIDIFYFEDAAELLLSTQELSEIFLLGTWKGDGYHFTMKEDGHISYNLPNFDYGDYYRIEDGNLLLFPENNESSTKTLFSFTAITPDCIEIFCYKDYKSYTLYRQ